MGERWSRGLLDPMGGYDCMYAGIEIRFDGKPVFTLDGRQFGQASCDTGEEACFVHQRLIDAAIRIVGALNKGECDVQLRG